MSISTVLPSATVEPSTLPSTLDSTVVFHGSHVIEEGGGSHTIDATVKIGGIEEIHVKSPSGILIGGQLPQMEVTMNKSGSFNAGMTNSNKKKFPPPPAPFGQSEERQLNKQSNMAQFTPGPGSYGKIGDFVNSKYEKRMDDNGSYIIKENGRINQRLQPYAASKSSRDALFIQQGSYESPGPGAYETNHSSFIDNHTIRGMKQYNKSPSPRNLNINNQAMEVNKSNVLLKSMAHNDSQSFTTASHVNQPSNYGHPQNSISTDDAQKALNQNQSYEGLLNPRMKKLANGSSSKDSKLGPGAYNVQDDMLRTSPKSNIKFGISKSQRADPFIKKTTLPAIGPGSYEYWNKSVGHKIHNPTIPRDPQNRSMFNSLPKRSKNPRNASIRDNFEDNSDSESDNESTSALSIPGPGSYHFDLNTFGKTSSKSENFQFFGSGVERFKNPHGSNSINAFQLVVGPGSYNSIQKPHSIRQQVFQNAGSASFLNSQRKAADIFQNTGQITLPGPGEYNPTKTGLIDPAKKLMDPSKVAFKSKIDRFHVTEMKKPDPGKYVLPGAMSPNALLKNNPLASYRSGTKRELQFDIDAEVPGIGVYNPQDYVSIGIQKIQGGAPNNFSLLAKKNTTLGVPQIDGNLDRAIYAETSTPANVGPGAYGGSKFKIIQEKSPRGDNSSNITLGGAQAGQQSIFGSEKRFREPSKEVPGPGQYADVNKWHKKTYNLKFLNVA